VQPKQDARADAAGFDELLNAGIADSHQRKLCRGKKSVGRNQEEHQEDPEQHKGYHVG
jgi:hypothetical protein